MQAIKDEHLKLIKRIKDGKPKLKSLKHEINKRDKKQLEYFDKLVNMETAIDYTKLYYQSGNKYGDAFNFNEFGSMVDFYLKINTEIKTLVDGKSKLVKFRNLLYLLEKTVAHKNIHLIFSSSYFHLIMKKRLKYIKIRNYCSKVENESIVDS